MTLSADTPQIIGGAPVLAERSFWKVDPWDGTLREDRQVQVRREALDAKVHLPGYLRDGLRWDPEMRGTWSRGGWRAGPPHETIWYSLWREAGIWSFCPELYGRWHDDPPCAYPDYGLYETEPEARGQLIEQLRAAVAEQRTVLATFEERISALEGGAFPTEPLPNQHEDCGS